MSKNYRIKDIAELSGVSTGTVDRILHNRGKVSEEAQKKVEKVLKEIDYQPNLIARSLALKKTYHFFTLIPSFSDGEYWAKFSFGIEKARQELFSYNVEIIPLYFDQYDKSSFDKLTQEIKSTESEGVVIATLFKESVLDLTKNLDEKGVPYILVDAYIEQTNCIAYYGTHSYDSGYIAGRLIFEQTLLEQDLAIFRFIRKGDLLSTQVQKREEGFRDFLEKNGFNGHIYSVQIHADDEESNYKLLDAFFREHSNVKSGIIFNSRAHLLGKYFTDRGLQSFKLIGYDVIDDNIQYLNNGPITHLIAQRPEVQGINSVKALFQYIISKKTPELINYMPIDVLMKENIKYYNNYI